MFESWRTHYIELQIAEDQTNWSLRPNILSSEDIELINHFPKILLKFVHNWIHADEESKNTVNDDALDQKINEKPIFSSPILNFKNTHR
jgi:hypothetical protein